MNLLADVVILLHYQAAYDFVVITYSLFFIFHYKGFLSIDPMNSPYMYIWLTMTRRFWGSHICWVVHCIGSGFNNQVMLLMRWW